MSQPVESDSCSTESMLMRMCVIVGVCLPLIVLRVYVALRKHLVTAERVRPRS